LRQRVLFCLVREIGGEAADARTRPSFPPSPHLAVLATDRSEAEGGCGPNPPSPTNKKRTFVYRQKCVF